MMSEILPILDNNYPYFTLIFVAMIDAEVNSRYCQSCGMPLRFDVED